MLELPLSTIAEVWVSSAPPTLIVVASVTREIVSVVVIESPTVEICSPVEDGESVLVETCSVLENDSVLVKTGSVFEGVSGAPVVTAGVEFSVSSGNLGDCVLS